MQSLIASTRESAEEALEIRSLPDADAKKEIKAHFEKHHGENLYPSEVAHALRLDYDQVARLIGELENAGELAAAKI